MSYSINNFAMINLIITDAYQRPGQVNLPFPHHNSFGPMLANPSFRGLRLAFSSSLLSSFSDEGGE